MENKKTLVIGASENPARYSNLAIRSLVRHNQPVLAIGLKRGEVAGVPVETEHLPYVDVHTVTLYVNKKNQQQYQDYILSLNPRRIIFNPGAENDELYELALEKGIKPMEACTLVLLSTGQF